MTLRTFPILIVLAAFACAASVRPAVCAEPPVSEMRGELRIWGSPADRGLIEALQAGSAKAYPQLTFATTLHGPESTIAGVYTGVADLAFMAREVRQPMEGMAFEWAQLSKVFEVEIANAGIDADRPATQLAVFVHKDNPLEHLSLEQLDAVLGAGHKRAPANLREWSAMIPGDGWAGRRIKVYGPPVDSIPALFVRALVMHDSRKWNPAYREIEGGDRAIVDALANDPAGIAYASMRSGDARVKALALGVDAKGPFHPLNAGTVASRSYPLTRVVKVVLKRPPGEAIEPKLDAFLRFVLSRAGQAIVAGEGSYIALSPESAQQQFERLR
jgi:phosphate transport system substrate-binding protein